MTLFEVRPLIYNIDIIWNFVWGRGLVVGDYNIILVTLQFLVFLSTTMSLIARLNYCPISNVRTSCDSDWTEGKVEKIVSFYRFPCALHKRSKGSCPCCKCSYFYISCLETDKTEVQYWRGIILAGAVNSAPGGGGEGYGAGTRARWLHAAWGPVAPQRSGETLWWPVEAEGIRSG